MTDTTASAPPPPSLRRVDVDVRADLAVGAEPFGRIMAAVHALAPDEALVLRAPFEPVPLYRALGARGFSHWTESRRPDDWLVWFFRDAPPARQQDTPPARQAPSATPAAPAPARSTLDVRELPPPLPLLRVLERLDTLGADDELVVLHDRRPLFLYPQIEARGFVHSTEEPEPGLVRIVVRHSPPDPAP